MNQTNLIAYVDARHLGKPLPPMEARQFASFVLRVCGAPDDATDLFARVFKPDGGYFDIPASRNGNGDWTARIIGTCFPNVGGGFYELHATDADGNPTALGRGRAVVMPFSVGGNAIQPGENVSVAVLPDQTGALHQVVAVNIDGEWTWEVRDVNNQ